MAQLINDGMDACVRWAQPQRGVMAGMNRRLAHFGRPNRLAVRAGVVLGSDQMQWPGVLECAIEAIDSAPFLRAQQKRDILSNTAARFLRLSKGEIARHHRGGRDAGAPLSR